MNNSSKGLTPSAIWYTAGNILSRGINFLLLPIYSNWISTEDFGKYALLISAYSIVSAFYQFGILPALTKFYLDEKDELKRKILYSTILVFILIVGVVLSFLLVTFSNVISNLFLGTVNPNLIIYISLSLLFESLALYNLHLLKTQENVKRSVLLSTINAFVNLGFNILFIIVFKWGIEGIILAQTLATGIFLISFSVEIRKNFIPLFDKAKLKIILKFSFPIFIAGILTLSTDFMDRFILDFYLTKNDVGIYSFAYRIAMIMNLFVISFRTAWIPRAISLYNSEKYEQSFGATFTKLVAISFWIILSVSFFSDDLFYLKLGKFELFNSAYESGIVIIPFVLLGYFFNGLASYFSIGPYIANNSNYFLISDLIGFLFNLILNIILIPQYGIVGAGIATTIGYSMAAAYLFLISKNIVLIKFEIKKLSFFCLAFVCLGTLGLIYNSLIINLILLIIFSLLLYKHSNIKLNRVNIFISP